MDITNTLTSYIQEEVQKQMAPSLALMDKLGELLDPVEEKTTVHNSPLRIGQQVRYRVTVGAGRPATGKIVRMDLQNSRVFILGARNKMIRCPVGRVYPC